MIRARGFNVLGAVRRPVVFPGDGDLKYRFISAAKVEEQTLKQLRNQSHGMQVLGNCWSKHQMAVELLTKTAYVAMNPELPWCARVKVAINAMGVVDMLHTKKRMHCDLKPDQLGIDRELNVKLVDADTLWLYPNRDSEGGATRHFAGDACKYAPVDSLKAETNHALTAQCCGACMQHSRPQTDCFCGADGKCPGISSDTTLVSVVCKMVLSDMLFRDSAFAAGTGNATEVPAAVRSSIAQLNSECVRDKWGLEQALGFLRGVWATNGGGQCLASHWKETLHVIDTAFLKRRDNAASRCKGRYCR